MKKLIVCDSPVESPAPVTPIPTPNIRIGSITIFTMLPARSPIIARFARPWYLSWLFNVQDADCSGPASIIKIAYCLAYG